MAYCSITAISYCTHTTEGVPLIKHCIQQIHHILGWDHFLCEKLMSWVRQLLLTMVTQKHIVLDLDTGGLCKTWTLDSGLDYGLDWTGLDWTDQNSCIQTANAAKATTAFLQLCLKLLPSLLRHQFLDFCEVKGHVHI